MRFVRIASWSLALSMLMPLLLPNAAQAICIFVGTPPDGRILGPYSIKNTSSDINLAFGVQAGRSYSVDVMTWQGPAEGIADLDVNINSNSCPAINLPGLSLRDTTLITPSIAGGLGALRRSLSVSDDSSVTVLHVKVHNASNSASSVVVSATETTMISAAWSTIQNYNTFYSFQNTTNSTCNVTLELSDTTGLVRTTASEAVASGATLSTNTATLGTPRELVGTATLTHDCPPNAINAEAAIQDFTIPTPFVQSVKFVQVVTPR